MELEDRVNRRLTALETRDSESAQVFAALSVGGLIPRDAITLDPQARRVLVASVSDGEEPRIAEAIDRIIAAARLKHPDWLIDTTAAAQPEE